MPGKIFVNYRRDDSRDAAARVRDRLAQAFGVSNVFMDVDNLLVGQRFDKELEKALDQCDVFLAVIGQRWMESLVARHQTGERDYVREEIAAALARGTLVIPVLIERTPLPRPDQLPEDIRALVLHQKHDVVHESFGRDIGALIEGIKAGRETLRPRSPVPWGKTIAGLLAVSVLGAGLFFGSQHITDLNRKAEEATSAAEDARRAQAEAAAKAEQERGRAEAAAAEAKRKDEQRVAAVPKAGETFRDCPECPEMVVVPGGEFMMGSPDKEAGRQSNEGPQRKVTIAKPFAAGKYEVTFAEWDACVAAGGCSQKPSDDGWGRDKRPVINVSWDDATKEYIPWLTKKSGKTYRLLTEAEWEYVARGGPGAKDDGRLRYWWGNDASHEYANYGKDECCDGLAQGKDQWVNTSPVGQFQGNPFGLHDLHGNVWEWVEDCWNDSYNGAPTDGSAWTSGDCSRRVLRGGSWGCLPVYRRSGIPLRVHHRLPGQQLRLPSWEDAYPLNHYLFTSWVQGEALVAF